MKTKTSAEWSVAACRGCGILLTDPLPEDSEWSAHYSPDYAPHQLRGSGASKLPRWKRRLAGGLGHVRGMRNEGGLWGLIQRWTLGPRLIAPFGRGRMLDVGCGADRYLCRMASLGWQAQGVDRSATAAERAKTEYGVDVSVSEIPGPNIPEGPFDLITLWQVLEHLSDPRGALAVLRDRLADDGRIVVSVPNAESWAARRFGGRWVGWDLPRHIVHFSPWSLRRMASSSGLDVVSMRTVDHTAWVQRSAHEGSIYRRRIAASLASRLAAWRGEGDSLLLVAKKEQVDPHDASRAFR